MFENLLPVLQLNILLFENTCMCMFCVVSSQRSTACPASYVICFQVFCPFVNHVPASNVPVGRPADTHLEGLMFGS
jgi:hypothetical protein